MNGPEIVGRYEKLKADRYNFDWRWERMASFISQSRMGIIVQYSPGVKRTQGVYDSTTMMAAEQMAMFIGSHLFSPAQRWLGWESGDPLGKDDDEIKEWLEECRDRTLKRLAASAFYAEAPESLVDWGGFGTGFLLGEEAPQPVNMAKRGFRGFYFHAQKIGHFVIAEGPDGLVDTAFREFESTARLLSAQFGEKGSLPPNIINAVKEGQLDKPYKVIHAIIPRPIGERSYGAKGMPWASCWIEKETKHIMFESGYRIFPVAAPRFHKTPNEIYGRGRGDIAFPDTWTLNTAKRMALEDWAFKIRPPLFTKSDSVIGSLKLVPGGASSINTHGGRIQDAIQAFDTGSRPEVSNVNEEKLRQSIREIFYVESIRQLMQVEKSEMTAFEFAKKIELLFRTIGPVYGRFEWEGLYKMGDIIWDVQMAAGAFSPPPESIYRTNGQINQIFDNPISKAQRAGDAESLALALGDLTPYMQATQNVDILDRLDPDKMADGILNLRGIPAKWMRNDDELAQFKQAKQQQHEQEQQMAMASQGAEAAGKAAPALKLLQGGGLPGQAQK